MPKLVSETTSGSQFTRSMQDGSVADSQVRVFKIILNAPNEVVDPQVHCNIRVGDTHPVNTNITCKSFDVRFDGESRLVMIVTFNYESQAHSSQQNQNDKPPELRAANWTTSTSLIEQPVYRWRKRFAVGWAADEPAVNPVGDIYEAVTQLTSIVNISVEQPEVLDPTVHNMYGGYINDETITLGNLVMAPHTLMFRGMSMKPHVETFQQFTFRGWIVTYDFCFKRHDVEYSNPNGGPVIVDEIGWDRLVPLTGFNVKNDRLGDADVDYEALSLEHEDYHTKITVPLNPPYTYATGTQGTVTRAMVAFPCPTGGWAQRPSASPVALNTDGTPRSLSGGRSPILQKYQTQPEIDFVQVMQLRLPDPTA